MCFFGVMGVDWGLIGGHGHCGILFFQFLTVLSPSPSAKHTKKHGKSPFYSWENFNMSMAMFNSDVSIFGLLIQVRQFQDGDSHGNHAMRQLLPGRLFMKHAWLFFLVPWAWKCGWASGHDV